MVPAFKNAKLVDAAVVRLPEAVNWYFPGSYQELSGDRVRVAAERVLRGRRGQGFGARVLVARKGLRVRDSGGERGSGPFGARRRRAAAAGRARTSRPARRRRALRRVFSFGGDGPSLASVPW